MSNRLGMGSRPAAKGAFAAPGMIREEQGESGMSTPKPDLPDLPGSYGNKLKLRAARADDGNASLGGGGAGNK